MTLNISKDTFYKHFKLLKECGYIEVSQKKTNNGKFESNIYTLCDVVPEQVNKKPCPKKPYTEKSNTEKPHTEISYTENMDTNNNSTKNNRSKNSRDKNNIFNKQSVRQDLKNKMSPIHPMPTKASEEDPKTIQGINTQDNYNTYREIIKENIDYPLIEQLFERNSRHAVDMGIVDGAVNIMLDAILSKGEYIKINGEEKPREIVKSALLKLKSPNILYVCKQFKNRTTPIKNKRNYILTMLYNSASEHNIESAISENILFARNE